MDMMMGDDYLSYYCVIRIQYLHRKEHDPTPVTHKTITDNSNNNKIRNICERHGLKIR